MRDPAAGKKQPMRHISRMGHLGGASRREIMPDGTHENAEIALQEVTAETVLTVCGLSVAESQKRMVAPNANSIARAYFDDRLWFRAIHANETPIGFIMLSDNPQGEDGPRYYLSQFMIAAEYQGKGYGRRALELLIDHARFRPGATRLELCFVLAEGCPEAFYAKFGFKRNGRDDGDEIGMTLEL